MDLSRKRFLQTAAAGAVTVPWLSGCFGDDDDGSGGSKGGPVQLTMWSHEGDMAKFLDAYAKQLSKQPGAKYKYKPIKVTVLPLQDVATKVLATLSARRALPDLMAIEINYFSRYMKNDIAAKVFTDLNPKISSMRDEVFDASWAAYSLNDSVYAVPVDLPLVGYYYREDLTKQLGISFPIATWEDLIDVGIKQAKPKGKYLSTLAVGKGGVGTAGVSSQFIVWLLQRGGSIFSDDGTEVTLESPEAVDVLSFMARGLKEGVFLDVDALYGPADVAALKTGKVIGHEGATWWRFVITRNLTEQEGKWRLATLPKFAGGGADTSTQGGTGYTVTKDSENQEAAWNLLHGALLTLEGQQAEFKKVSFNPTLKEAYEDPFFLGYADPVLGGQKKFADVYSKVAPNAPIQHQSPYWSSALEALDREVAQALTGDKSPESAIKDAAAQIKEDVASAS
jgi:arabinosaccharide transport system substrate-binding protein